MLKGPRLSAEEYERVWQQQGGVCAVCQCPETLRIRGKVMRLAVDHSHQTGENRGLLCNGCNQALGWCKDSPRRLRALIAYLQRYHPLAD